MEDNKNEYNGCLGTILILWLIGGVISLIFNLVFFLNISISGITICTLICEFVSLIGLVFLIGHKKIGFYLFVGSYVVLLILLLVIPELYIASWFWRLLLGLILFFILMGIKNKDTQRNGFQILGITGSEEDYGDEEKEVFVNENFNDGQEKVIVNDSCYDDFSCDDNSPSIVDHQDNIITSDTEESSNNKENANAKSNLVIPIERNLVHEEELEQIEDSISQHLIDNIEQIEDSHRDKKIKTGWVIIAISMAALFILCGVIYFTKCEGRTLEEIYKDAKTLIDNKQYKKGITELEKIQDKYIPAKALLGHLLVSNDSVYRDMIRGEKLLWDAFEKNDTSAGRDLVGIYFDREDWDKTYKIADKLALLNCAKGYSALSRLYAKNKIAGESNKHKDYSKAEFYALKVAEKDAESCHYLGYIYSEGGYGIEQDYEKAFYWWNHGAQLGNAVCYSNLGWLYLNGCGVEKSYKKAFESFQNALKIDKTDGYSMFHIASMYYDGLYVKENKDSARVYFQKAAKCADEEAAIDAAIMLENHF